MYSLDLVDSAHRSLQAAEAVARGDPARPVFHFRPLAGWMNDINGPLYHQGHFHVFYQVHPFSADWGNGDNMMWGHARSRDLVFWEHLPLAVWPARELGETSCWSGTSCISGSGQPLLFYTKCGPDRQNDPYEQWAMVAQDDDLMRWEKHPLNPIMTLRTHGQSDFSDNWRDPFVFSAEGRTFMILGCSAPQGTPLYEALNKDYTQWACKGFMAPMNAECPNFFKLQDKWIFLSSVASWAPDCFDPEGQGVKYYIGSFDMDALTFRPERDGFIDRHGSADSFYGSNILFDDKGRCILLGRTQGFRGDRGWQGCMALPRTLTIDARGLLVQTPMPELRKLRRRRIQRENLLIERGTTMIAGDPIDTLEIQVTMDRGTAESCGLRWLTGDNRELLLEVKYDGHELTISQARYRLEFNNDPLIRLHVFLDKSFLELFVNDGKEYISHVLESSLRGQKLELFAQGGVTSCQRLELWQITECASSRPVPVS